MKRILLIALGVCSICTRPALVCAQERFSGLHFDFHATLQDSSIGKTFTYGLIDSLFQLTKPDFIQVDCKGHPGISSYPTTVGSHPPVLETDILNIWKEVAQKHATPLYVHYSGLWDTRAIALHPQWALINPDGTADKNATSMLGPYEDSLLVPQLKELIDRYQLNGAWIDGDCWVLKPDYSPQVMKQFTAATGIAEVPKKTDAPHYFEWMEFNRKLFRSYVARYVNAVHAVDPSFQITSNWSFSSMMPEPVDIPVNFLSGDVAGSNSVYSSAFESRCLALQGKPWDLMSWSFAWKNGIKGIKSVPQIKQEAAEVLAMGGGYQTYWQQNRDGSPEPGMFANMAEIIQFCKDRKAFSFGGTIVPQIGILYATYAWKRIPDAGLYNSHGQAGLKGTLNMVLDSQLPAEIIMDHQLGARLDQYPVIIFPEWETIDPAQKQALLKYVENGGNLIVTGANGVTNFSEELGVKISSGGHKDSLVYAGIDDQIIAIKSNFRPFELLEGTQAVGSQLRATDWRFKQPSALGTVRSYGKGKIAGIYMDMGATYMSYKNPVLKKLLNAVISQLSVQFAATVTGSSYVHQVVSEKNEKRYVHLINTSGPHDDPNTLVYNEVSTLSGLTVTLPGLQKPKAVKWQPSNEIANYTIEQGQIKVEVPPLAIYQILEIEN